jgi:hypothetical protein
MHARNQKGATVCHRVCFNYLEYVDIHCLQSWEEKKKKEKKILSILERASALGASLRGRIRPLKGREKDKSWN